MRRFVEDHALGLRALFELTAAAGMSAYAWHWADAGALKLAVIALLGSVIVADMGMVYRCRDE